MNPTETKMTRQRKWQIERQLAGRCIICGRLAITALHCKTHRDAHNARQREKRRGTAKNA